MAVPGSLTQKLNRRIAEHGPMSVAAYMEACLADPDHGYYRTRDPLGRRGDFITAPEVSQIFGELIGLWCVEVWRGLGAPSPFNLVELGPGRGTLMADALRASRVAPEFAGAARLHLVETSPVLRQAQKERLGAHKPCWHDALADVPAGPALIIANEFLDALPVRQFTRAHEAWHERLVTAEQGRLAYCLSDAPLGDESLIPEAVRDAARDGDMAEVRTAAEELAAEIGRLAGAHPLAALFIDYGHVRSAPGDTLQAVSGHGYANPLEAPGEQDLTAHVDFETFGYAARAAGLKVHGPVSQGDFLPALGLAQRCERLMKEAEPEQAQAVETGARRLVDPAQMGALFKVMALTAPGIAAPPPFEELEAGET
jgi:NADH dehydrogenase [ubiquinone] 1 alpha subcomplex assembly factor 7